MQAPRLATQHAARRVRRPAPSQAERALARAQPRVRDSTPGQLAVQREGAPPPSEARGVPRVRAAGALLHSPGAGAVLLVMGRAAALRREAPARGASDEAHSPDPSVTRHTPPARIPRGHQPPPSRCKRQPQTGHAQGSGC